MDLVSQVLDKIRYWDTEMGKELRNENFSALGSIYDHIRLERKQNRRILTPVKLTVDNNTDEIMSLWITSKKMAEDGCWKMHCKE